MRQPVLGSAPRPIEFIPDPGLNIVHKNRLDLLVSILQGCEFTPELLEVRDTDIAAELPLAEGQRALDLLSLNTVPIRAVDQLA